MAKLTVPIVVDWDSIKDRIKNGDLVEVVRCKDCKHKYVPDDMEDKWCYWVDTDEDDFCSYGERREKGIH